MKIHREVVRCLVKGGVGVIPTDTIYGLVGSAFSPEAVERMYRLRKREAKKPFIVLIASPRDVKKFGVKPSLQAEDFFKKIWPGPVSVILPCSGKRFRYLHRGGETLAFRVPEPRWLRALVAKSGPLVAPSANPAGKKPAATVRAAYGYFKGNVDFYVDGGRIAGVPSTLIKILR